jgi:putative transposase
VPDILVQERRKWCGKRFFKQLLRGIRYKPRRFITDGLRNYGAAHGAIPRDVSPSDEQVLEQSGWQPTSTHPATRVADAAHQVI